MTLSEFELIRRFFTHPARNAVLGVGDDAAIVRARRGRELVVTTDMLVAGRHFHADADPEQLGHKALAVNLSDIAAMGARPRWATLALALPRADARWLAAFSRGFMRLARRHGVDLVGGDTTRGPLTICVQVIGEAPRGRALRRDGARAGDDVWVSGTLGDAALALAAMQGRVRMARRERRALQLKLDAPVPRVALGIALRGIARSAIDVSDGLVADLGHICERSRVSAVVQFDRLPASAIMARNLGRPAAREALLSGGDDYELVFTAGRSRRDAIHRLSRRLRLKLTCIGKIARRRRGAPLVTVLDAAGRPVAVKRGGYEHF
ncbi:MAG: thiamine-phosphate kinase [Burkholderiales bacterium]